MTISIRFLLKNTAWTVGAYGLIQAVRLITNVILARLLAPEVFGIILIVNTLKMGIELISDVGISQNIIYHKEANDPDFYNTAWTLQALRGLGLWLVAAVFAAPIARFYQSPILLYIVPLMTFVSVISGFSSISLPLVQKRLQIVKLNAFEFISAFCGSTALVLFVFVSPTIWALVFGNLFASTLLMVGSYFLLPDVRQRFYLSKRYAREILHFGKWIFASSIVYFLSSNFDRLYLAKVITLDLLGVYGIARSISELLSLLVLRFSNYVLFPLIASHTQLPRAELRGHLVSIRLKFMLLAGLGFSLITAIADLPIKILYDQRYQAAGWMLPFLIIGSWFSMLACINESTLLGLGKPSYSAIANSSKFIFLLIGLPLSVSAFGVLGGILVVVGSDLFRYFPILVGQRREKFSFGMQDLVITLITFLLVGLWEWLRWVFGFGYSFESLPISVITLFGANR